MNKYSEMSDWDINHKIAEVINNKEIPKGIGRDVFIPKICENYHDAFKLMIDSNISLTPSTEDATWIASGVINYRMSIFPVEHGNPCRAIAECFLLMKDEEIGNE